MPKHHAATHSVLPGRIIGGLIDEAAKSIGYRIKSSSYYLVQLDFHIHERYGMCRIMVDHNGTLDDGVLHVWAFTNSNRVDIALVALANPSCVDLLGNAMLNALRICGYRG